MALIVCPECGKQVSDKAATCPNCGAPLEVVTIGKGKKKKEKKEIPLWGRIVVAVVASIMLITMVFRDDDTNDSASTSTTTVKETATPEPVIEATAAEIYSAYKENVVNADAMYKNKKVSVTGTVTDITTSLVLEEPCVCLDSGDEWGLYPLECFFTEANDEIAALRNGDVVTITGKCTGYDLGVIKFSSCDITG